MCGSLSKELHIDGGMLAGCKSIVMKLCLINKEKVLRLCLPSHTYMLLSKILYVSRYSTKKYRRLRAIAGNTSHIKIFLILCIQFVLCMDCQFMK